MRVASKTLAALASGFLSLGCLSEITLPDPDPAFATSATSYTLQVSGTIQSVQVNYVYTDQSGAITALQGCTGGVTRWFLEKQVGSAWQEVYPVCTANDAEGKAVAAGGTYASSVTITDFIAEGGSPRISHRPIAGTYRLRFGLYENLNFATGVGTLVNDGRQYSNTFTLQ
ncbi:MAG: hypothetical protein SGI84_06780 [Gemmatimonadota bacterium]|nr:hypothetical protein [Gemmatimonadota bacterium]